MYNNEACIRLHQALTSKDHMVRIVGQAGLALLQVQPNLNPFTTETEGKPTEFWPDLFSCVAWEIHLFPCAHTHIPALFPLYRVRCSWCWSGVWRAAW